MTHVWMQEVDGLWDSWSRVLLLLGVFLTFPCEPLRSFCSADRHGSGNAGLRSSTRTPPGLGVGGASRPPRPGCVPLRLCPRCVSSCSGTVADFHRWSRGGPAEGRPVLLLAAPADPPHQ